jgi:NADH:ubiquinone oxidoreductase subunit 5 (subunit L)/multisubunit Na+/H+ antiporter MnhA subunit
MFLLLLLLLLLSYCLGFFFIFSFNVCHFVSFYLVNLAVNNVNLLFIMAFSLVVLPLMMYTYHYFQSFNFFSHFRAIYLGFALVMLWFLLNVNTLSIFILWEILGFASFFLIGALVFRVKALYSSLSVLWFTAIGNFSLFIFVVFYFTVNYSFFFSYNLFLGYSWILLYIVLSKSSLWPFSHWIFLAMEGPLVVSSLLHSSTVIILGTYLYFVLFHGILPNYVLIFLLFSFVYFTIHFFLYGNLKYVVASSTGFFNCYFGLFIVLGFKYLAYVYMILHALVKSFTFIVLANITSLVSLNLRFNNITSPWLGVMSLLLLSLFVVNGTFMFLYKEYLIYGTLVFRAEFYYIWLAVIACSTIYNCHIFHKYWFSTKFGTISNSFFLVFYVFFYSLMLLFCHSLAFDYFRPLFDLGFIMLFILFVVFVMVVYYTFCSSQLYLFMSLHQVWFLIYWVYYQVFFRFLAGVFSALMLGISLFVFL